jgi:hypothetical protein
MLLVELRACACFQFSSPPQRKRSAEKQGFYVLDLHDLMAALRQFSAARLLGVLFESVVW